ncbi:MAG: ribonuclease III [Candidatus Falkowbacteria bacterium]
MADFAKLQKRLDCEFKNLSLLQQALVHRSYINEHPEFPLGHNERLEFLGDAVLEIVVTEHLYHKFPNTPEGELTDWRASLVNAKMLAQVADSLGLEEYLFLSKGEAKDKNTKARQYILANAVEAVIGAMYLDQGIEPPKKLIIAEIIKHLEYIVKNQLHLDPKSLFQEKSQEIFNITPHYEILEQTGPDHDKKFRVGLYIKNELIATGFGTSKHEAQVDAATIGLEKKGW